MGFLSEMQAEHPLQADAWHQGLCGRLVCVANPWRVLPTLRRVLPSSACVAIEYVLLSWACVACLHVLLY
jgi:hypothetical protein